MKTVSDAQSQKPFRRFQQLTERLLAVPKKELDEKLAEYERKKKPKKPRKK